MQDNQSDDNRENVVLYETKKADLTPEQKLAIAMIVLTIQDLNLENNFPDLRNHYVIPKTKKTKNIDIIQSFEYIHDVNDYVLSFNNCCFYLQLEHESVRKRIIAKLKVNGEEVYDLYRAWRSIEDA